VIQDTSSADTQRLAQPVWQRRRLHVLLLILATACGLAALAWPSFARWNSASLTLDAQRLRLATVERGEFVRDVAAQGQIVAAIRPMLFSPRDGRITINTRAGDKVSRDDVLAIIESPELRSNYQQEEATLLKLQTELSRQEISSRMDKLEQKEAVSLAGMELTAAERELRRAESAYRQDAISLQDHEKANDDRDRAAAIYQHKTEAALLKSERLGLELDILNHALNRQELQVAELQRQVEALEIRSPVDGVVGNLEVQQKSMVARYQAILSVVDMSAYEIEAAVPETYADDLALGMDVDIDFSGDHYRGQLSAIAPEIVQGRVRCRIRFTGEKPQGLRQNQRVSSRILLDARQNVLMVTRGPFMQGSARGYAYVVEDGVAIRTPIVAGMTSAGRVEILSGLQEGQRIVISSSDIFGRHERVFLNNPPQATQPGHDS
jgi:HlyD family secretion protein